MDSIDIFELKRIHGNLSLYISEIEEIDQKRVTLSRLEGRIKVDLDRLFYNGIQEVETSK